MSDKTISDKSASENKPVIAISNEFEQKRQKDGMFFKFFAFLSLTDYEVLKECGKYDRTLVYAMVFRQLVTFAFTCMLFTYHPWTGLKKGRSISVLFQLRSGS